MSRKPMFLNLALLLSLLLPGCGVEEPSGKAQIGITVKGLSAADVTRITMTVSGSGISPSIVQNLYSKAGQWAGIIGQIPAGTNRTFLAEAYNASSVLVYQGQAAGVTITAGAQAAVVIVLQQKTAPTPFTNSSPQITALVASSNQIGPGGSITLTVTASDADGDTLIYAWSSNSIGTFSAASSATTTWTAPATVGNYPIIGIVSDSKGGMTYVALVVEVATQYQPGTASVSATINSSPSITRMSILPGQLVAGGKAMAEVVASDPDGDTLSYSWSDGGCGGAFDNATSMGPNWTAPATLPTGFVGYCLLAVTVSDGNGGSASGSTKVYVGGALPINMAPVVDAASQSASTAGVGEVLILEITAHDPESKTLTFAWSTTGGNLSTPSTTSKTGGTTSKLNWAPPPAAGSHTVTVAVSDADGASTSFSFSVANTGFTSTVSTVAEETEDMWVNHSGDIWAVGSAGVILHFNGTAWATTNIGATTYLKAVWGSSASNIWAVGSAGAIVHYNGTTWSAVTSGTIAHLNDVWGSSASDVWAVGSAGTVLHYNGTAWSVVAAGLSGILLEVQGSSASDVWVMTQSSIHHYNGTAWTTAYSAGFTLTDIHVSGASDVWAVGYLSMMGSSTNQIVRYNGTSWSSVSATGITEGVRRVYVRPGTGSVPVVSAYPGSSTQQNKLYSLSGTTWQEMSSFGTESVAAMDGDPTAGIWVLGDSGTVKSCIGTTCSLNRAGVKGVNAVWGTSASDVWLAGDNGRVLNYDGSAWTVSLHGANTFNDVWASSASDIWAVGDGGSRWRYDGTTWKDMSTTSVRAVHALWGSSATNVWTWAFGGYYQQYNGSIWSTEASSSIQPNDMWGSSASDIWVVGNSGALRHYNGTAWSSTSDGTADISAVWGVSANNVWTVGDGGRISHYNGSTWSSSTSGSTANLNAIWGTTNNDIWAAGDGGTLLHYNGIGWGSMTSGLTASLGDLWGSSISDVWVTATYSGKLVHLTAAGGGIKTPAP